MASAQALLYTSKFQVCHEVCYLQQLGNYLRARHYVGIDPETGKQKFLYHHQSRVYTESQWVNNLKGENFIHQTNIEQLIIGQKLNLKV